MFHSARLKLTSWYLLIIILISSTFSFVIYELLTYELNRVEEIQRLREEGLLPDYRKRTPIVDTAIIEEIKERLKIRLLIINLAILSFSGIAGYFLAGKTLSPIADMVNKQNRFITDASHELRTPLTSLKTEIEVGLRDRKIDLQKAKYILSSNLEEVNNLQYLTDNLIKISQNQNFQDELSIKKISSLSLVEDSVNRVKKIAKLKKIKIEKSNEDFSFYADNLQLTELTTVLLDNAIKYSPKNSCIKLDVEKTPTNIIIRVTDYGIGIDKNELPFLFDRFYRTDKSRSEKGYGLGLSIARQIAKKHKGSIDVESKINQGSVFLVKLPLL